MVNSPLWRYITSWVFLTSMSQGNFMKLPHFYVQYSLHGFTSPSVFKIHFMINLYLSEKSLLHGHLTPMCTNYTSWSCCTFMFKPNFKPLSYLYAILTLHESLPLLCVSFTSCSFTTFVIFKYFMWIKNLRGCLVLHAILLPLWPLLTSCEFSSLTSFLPLHWGIYKPFFPGTLVLIS